MPWLFSAYLERRTPKRQGRQLGELQNFFVEWYVVYTRHDSRSKASVRSRVSQSSAACGPVFCEVSFALDVDLEIFRELQARIKILHSRHQTSFTAGELKSLPVERYFKHDLCTTTPSYIVQIILHLTSNG